MGRDIFLINPISRHSWENSEDGIDPTSVQSTARWERQLSGNQFGTATVGSWPIVILNDPPGVR